MPDIAMIDANANADPDPNAASGSGSGSGSGGADNTDNAEDADDARKKRTERTWPLALTTAGMTWLAKYVHNTFFGKKIAAFDDAEGYVIVTARQEVRGEFTIKTLAIGSNAAMQAKADEALATIHDETIQDEVEGARQVVVLAPPVEYVLRSRLEDRRKDAKEILEVMWRDKFDDVIAANGKRGVDCLQIGQTIRDNPHMSPEWWDPIVGDGDRAYTLYNIEKHCDKIITTLGPRAYEIKMRKYTDTMGGIEKIEKARVKVALQKIAEELVMVRMPWIKGLVAMAKAVVAIEDSAPGSKLAQAIADAGIEAGKYAAMLGTESHMQFDEIAMSAQRSKFKYATDASEVNVSASRSHAIAMQQAAVRAARAVTDAKARLEEATTKAGEAAALALMVPEALRCKKKVLCKNYAGHVGQCQGKLFDLLKLVPSFDPWHDSIHMPGTMRTIRDVVDKNGSTMAEAFGKVNWVVAEEHKEAYDEWYNRAYIVDDEGESIGYGESIWAEIVKYHLDELIPPPPEMPTKTSKNIDAEAKKAIESEKKRMENEKKKAFRAARLASEEAARLAYETRKLEETRKRRAEEDEAVGNDPKLARRLKGQREKQARLEKAGFA
jgi:hypothetical protein